MKLKEDLAVILGGYGGMYKITPGPKMKHERYAFACTTFKSRAHEGQPVIVVAGSQTGTGRTAAILDYTLEDSEWEKRKSLQVVNSNLPEEHRLF